MTAKNFARAAAAGVVTAAAFSLGACGEPPQDLASACAELEDQINEVTSVVAADTGGLMSGDPETILGDLAEDYSTLADDTAAVAETITNEEVKQAFKPLVEGTAELKQIGEDLDLADMDYLDAQQAVLSFVGVGIDVNAAAADLTKLCKE